MSIGKIYGNRRGIVVEECTLVEEREIDLIDLFAEVLRHWKGAVVGFLVGALLFGIYGYVENLKEAEAIEEVQETEMTFAEQKVVDVALEYESLYLQAKEDSDVENLLILNKAVIDSVKGFNDVQLQYFTENSVSDLWEGEFVPQVITKEHKGMSVKKVIIGGAVAFFLYCMFWAVRYILDGDMKASDDMQQLAGVPQLGKIYTVEEPSFIIDKWIFRLKHHGQRLMTADKSVELIASVIAVNAKSKSISEITFSECTTAGKA